VRNKCTYFLFKFLWRLQRFIATKAYFSSALQEFRVQVKYQCMQVTRK